MTTSNDSYITIDHGNTNTSILFHENNKSMVITVDEYKGSEYLKSLKGSYSSVGKNDDFIPSNLINIKKYLMNNYFLDMKVYYSDTLGSDRLITSYYLFKNKLKTLDGVILIDSGTFTTIDIIANLGFMGGYIFPGITPYFQSYENGRLLPKISQSQLKVSKNSFVSLPNDTQQAILGTFPIYMKGVLNEFLAQYPTYDIYVTGGNRNYLEEFIPQANFIPGLTHDSLKYFYRIIQQRLKS